MWKKLINWVRKMPVAKWIKPIWKGAIKDIVQKEGDRLQREAKALIAHRMPRAIDASVDNWQRAILAAFAAVPMPSYARNELTEVVQVKGDHLQQRLKEAVELGSDPLIDSVFDYIQAAIIARVDAL